MPAHVVRVVCPRGAGVTARRIELALREALDDLSRPAAERGDDDVIDVTDDSPGCDLGDFDFSTMTLEVSEDSQGLDGQLSQAVIDYVVNVAGTTTPLAGVWLWHKVLARATRRRLGSGAIGEPTAIEHHADAALPAAPVTVVVDVRVEEVEGHLDGSR